MDTLKDHSFKQLVDQHPRAIMLATTEPTITYVNQQFCRVTGYSVSEIVGLKPSVLSSGFHSEQFYADMWHTIAEQGHWEGVIWNRRKSGEIYPQWLNIFPIEQEGERLYAGAFLDVSELNPRDRGLESMAYFDTLTELPNRSLFREFLNAKVSQCESGGSQFAVLFIDLDFFKGVNDLHGHDVGDQVLRQAAASIRRVMRESDVLARLSGDEFAAIIDLDHGDAILETVGQRIVDVFHQPIPAEDKDHFLSASVGAAVFPKDGTSGDDLLQNADRAMYEAKNAGRSCFHRFRQDESERSLQEQRVAEALVESLKTTPEEFSVVYQPQFDLTSDRLIGMEVLVRWDHADIGPISPAEFIEVCERRGLIHELMERVVACVVADLSSLTTAVPRGLGLALNISAGQFADARLLALIEPIVRETRRLGWVPELEITETHLMHLSPRYRRQLEAFGRDGVRIAVDDFGTGYSSLAYLHELPIHILKIDRQFVARLGEERRDLQIVSAVLGMAQALELEVIAEGIETDTQRQHLVQLNCLKGQGFLMARPMRWDQLSQRWLM
ncbi:putative bifunctional diguanylate cyclase/phosphodiesterase [Marinobacter sp. CA1]|uniref:putative bifunctional diguanylate cyclase/phosphodiesterase n=1 Tax=Marinobacter sp. CA1 TaxID=2817656 RepID=UPI001D062942|nr:EAL domain-containing protein [Marinobacter sp. CA1]UDL05655.1 EAL domain-containing protein [Marinobacter sp. CA1]